MIVNNITSNVDKLENFFLHYEAALFNFKNRSTGK